MFRFARFTDLDWMAYSGAECFADGAAPLLSVGDVLIDDAPADIVIDRVGVHLHWEIDDQNYIVTAEGAAGTCLLVMLRPQMTIRDLKALPGVDVVAS